MCSCIGLQLVKAELSTEDLLPPLVSQGQPVSSRKMHHEDRSRGICLGIALSVGEMK